jgi:hypothetical protein
LISAWMTNSSMQTNTATITLNSQQLYNIQMDYFQSTGNAGAQLLWSSPSTPQTIIPTTQLYPYTNPPPSIAWLAPTSGANYTAAASVSLSANAATLYNALSYVSFFTNGALLGVVTNPPYAFTTTGLAAGTYALTARATDGSGLSSTTAPVSITINPASGLPYGLTTNGILGGFLNGNMPGAYTGPLPTLLSQRPHM